MVYKFDVWIIRLRPLTRQIYTYVKFNAVRGCAMPPPFSDMVLPAMFLSLLLLSSRAEGQANGERRTAAATLSTESAAGADLFSNEAVQLTESVLLGLNDQDDLAQYAYMFAFGNSTNSPEEPSDTAGDCKTYPGDQLWPSEELWGIFDELLGDALNPIVPIASPCYKDSEYDNYDAALCASVTEGWVEEETQRVVRIFHGCL